MQHNIIKLDKWGFMGLFDVKREKTFWEKVGTGIKGDFSSQVLDIEKTQRRKKIAKSTAKGIGVFVSVIGLVSRAKQLAAKEKMSRTAVLRSSKNVLHKVTYFVSYPFKKRSPYSPSNQEWTPIYILGFILVSITLSLIIYNIFF